MRYIHLYLLLLETRWKKQKVKPCGNLGGRQCDSWCGRRRGVRRAQLRDPPHLSSLAQPLPSASFFHSQVFFPNSPPPHLPFMVSLKPVFCVHSMLATADYSQRDAELSTWSLRRQTSLDEFPTSPTEVWLEVYSIRMHLEEPRWAASEQFRNNGK